MTDVSITAANVAPTGSTILESGIAGEAISAGESVFLNSSKEIVLGDADDTSLDEFVGIAMHAAADGQPITYAKGGGVTIGGTLVAGAPYYLSATAGGIAPYADLTTGDRVIHIGDAISTSVLQIRPYDTGVIVG